MRLQPEWRTAVPSLAAQGAVACYLLVNVLHVSELLNGVFVYGKTVQSCYMWYFACIVFLLLVNTHHDEISRVQWFSMRFKGSVGLRCRQNTWPTFYTFCIPMLTLSEVFGTFGWVLTDILTAGNSGWTLNLASTQPALGKRSPHLHLCY